MADNWKALSAIVGEIATNAEWKREDAECKSVDHTALDALSAAKSGDLAGAMVRMDDLRAYLIRVFEERNQ